MIEQTRILTKCPLRLLKQNLKNGKAISLLTISRDALPNFTFLFSCIVDPYNALLIAICSLLREDTNFESNTLDLSE